MTVTFPSDFKCDEVMNELYPIIEGRLMPYIVRSSRKLARASPVIEYEDAVQEGRMALLSAMAKFDYNKSINTIEGYVQKVIANTYLCLIYETITQSRVPHIWHMEEDGQWIKKPQWPTSLDAMLASDSDHEMKYEPTYENDVSQDQQAHRARVNELAKEFNMKMLNRLKGKEGNRGGWEKDVFRCKVNPPFGLLQMMKDDGENIDPTKAVLDNVDNKYIAKYLGINKNAVDWAMHKIKKLFTELVKSDEDFSRLLIDVIGNRGWPMIHATKGNRHDEHFQSQILSYRKLDTRPSSESEWPVLETAGEKCADGRPYWSRLIQQYPWGCKMVLKKGQEYVSMVIEGRLNSITGEVFGDSGMCEDVTSVVPWYRELVRALRQEH